MKLSTVAKGLAVLPLVVALANCSQEHKPVLAKPGTYAFDITVRISPKAEAALKKSGAGLTVDAWYYGDAAPAHMDQADKLGRIFLGDENWNFSGNARKMHLKGEPIDTSKLPQTRDGQPQVLLSVEPDGGDPDNMLKCHDFIGKVQLAQQTPPVILCEFDTERYWEDNADSASQ
ncbi:hypothetical protein [Asticcacaulis solisilvae]|uniref:hypothetical protein n=1 Tax=Asticcacaulis solisilvae TaxID=1217274 RepID=UPI003FD87E50